MSSHAHLLALSRLLSLQRAKGSCGAVAGSHPPPATTHRFHPLKDDWLPSAPLLELLQPAGRPCTGRCGRPLALHHQVLGERPNGQTKCWTASGEEKVLLNAPAGARWEGKFFPYRKSSLRSRRLLTSCIDFQSEFSALASVPDLARRRTRARPTRRIIIIIGEQEDKKQSHRLEFGPQWSEHAPE